MPSTTCRVPGGPTNGSGDNSAIITQSVTGLDVGHNLISGYVIGTYVSGGGASGSIHDNRFQGDGGPLTGMGNGVNSETSTVVISGNTFDGTTYTITNQHGQTIGTTTNARSP